MKKSHIITWLAVGVLIVGAAIVFRYHPQNASGRYDQFAQCLKDKGATFYGAFWCPHCQNQKRMFGSSEKYLPYVECSSPDGKTQNQVCREKNITGYPTWIFADGSRKEGEVQLTDLSRKTSCSLPQ